MSENDLAAKLAAWDAASPLERSSMLSDLELMALLEGRRRFAEGPPAAQSDAEAPDREERERAIVADYTALHARDPFMAAQVMNTYPEIAFALQRMAGAK